MSNDKINPDAYCREHGTSRATCDESHDGGEMTIQKFRTTLRLTFDQAMPDYTHDTSPETTLPEMEDAAVNVLMLWVSSLVSSYSVHMLHGIMTRGTSTLTKYLWRLEELTRQ